MAGDHHQSINTPAIMVMNETELHKTKCNT